MMVDPETKQRVRQIDPERIARALGLEQNKRDRNKWRCPFCGSEDDSGDNLHVNPKGKYQPDGKKCAAKCFADCVTCSDTIAFVQEFEGLDFIEAVEWLCAEEGIELETNGQQPSKPKRGNNAAPRRAQQTPPKHRQNATDKNDKFNPPDIRVEIFERIWQAVKPTDLTDAAIRYLEDRNINPLVAKSYGCRCWWPVMGDIFDILRDYDVGDLRHAGLLSGNGKPWWPLRAFKQSKSDERGIAVPVWHPEYDSGPVAIRWRTYAGDNTDFDPYQKVYQQPSGPDNFEQPPLGLLEPPPHSQMNLYWGESETWLMRWGKSLSETDFKTLNGYSPLARFLEQIANDHRPRDIGDYPGNYAVVFCEGETDWLSVASAAAELETSMRIVPVGVTSMSSSWPERWTSEIEGADKVAVMFDYGNPDNDNPKGVARRNEIRNQLRDRWSPLRGDDIRWHLREDDNDLNDLREAGQLKSKIIEVLE